jgi:hypothetical protein
MQENTKHHVRPEKKHSYGGSEAECTLEKEGMKPNLLERAKTELCRPARKIETK